VDRLIASDQGHSIREILLTELALIVAVTDGKSAASPLNFDYLPADWLSRDQQTALRHVLQSTDRITGIRGLAGAGKTKPPRSGN
jgi:superfamily I DNA and RNA helicase